MSLFSYISFPREVDKNYLTKLYSRDKSELTEPIPIRLINDMCNVAVTNIYNVFFNKFIYEFLASLNLYQSNIYIDMNEQEKNEWYRVERDMKNRTVYHRKQLYDIIKLNIKTNEFVEIHSIFVYQIKGKDIFDFKPPKEIRKISIEEILTSELLECDRDLKIIIYR